MFSASENESSTIPGECSHADIMDSVMPSGRNVSRARADDGQAIALCHTVTLPHQSQECVGICKEGIATQDHSRPRSVAKQVKCNAAFFHFRCDPRHLDRSRCRRWTERGIRALVR